MNNEINYPISVLIPVYNTKEDELRQCIESVLEQTFGDFELVLINDGSTNNAEDVILSYSDERIKYHKNETNLGLIKTLNNGLELAQGKYIARLDADDYSRPERLEKQYKYMEENSNVGLLGTWFERVPHGGISDYLPTNPRDIKFRIRYAPGGLLHSSAMLRKTTLLENNLKYNVGCVHAEDQKLWGDLSYVTDIYVLPEVLVSYRKSDDGICATNHKWQNKMLSLIVLENIVRDFASDEKFMHEVMRKFASGEPLSKKEFFNLKGLLEHTINFVKKTISEPYCFFVMKFVANILKYVTVKNDEQ